MKRRGRRPHPDILTPREWEVLGLIREGLSNEQIAERLEISVDGAKYHVSEILSKLGARDRLEAARWSAERRPWWAIAVAPLGLWRRPIVAKLLVSAVALAVAAGGGLLVWGLLVTRGDNSESRLAANGTPTPPVDEVLLFDTASGLVKKVSDGHSLMLAKWVTEGKTFIAFDTNAAAWKLYDVNGKELRTLVTLPPEHPQYITIHLYPSRDGKTAIELRQTASDLAPPVVLGLTILDLLSGNETAFQGPSGENSNPLFSPDGMRLAYTNQNGSTVSLLVSDPDGSHGNALRSVTGPDNHVFPIAWSADSSKLLVEAYHAGPPCASSCTIATQSFEIISASGQSVWRMNVDRLTNAHWAGTERLLIDQPQVNAADGQTLTQTARLVRIADSAESTVPPLLEGADFIDVSPSGRFAIAGFGEAPDRRCSLIDLNTGAELTNKDQAAVSLCGYASEWTLDDRLVLASFPGI